MKLLLLLLFTLVTSIFINRLYSQDAITNQDPYLIFRAKNMFSIMETTDAKQKGYQVLTTIEYIDKDDKEVHSLTPEKFIQLFNNGSIDSLELNIKRSKETEIWYRLGDTDFVLIGYPEDQIVKKYNQTTK